jgi:hypothetical protein
MNRPKITTRVDPPVSGKLHTSTANIINHPRACRRHNSGQSD